MARDEVRRNYRGANYALISELAGTIPVVLFDGGTTLATSALADVGRWVPTTDMAGTLTEVRGKLATASSSGSVTAVVSKNGTSIGTLTFAAAATEASLTGLSVAIALGDYITVHVTGAGTGAKMLTVVGQIKTGAGGGGGPNAASISALKALSVTGLGSASTVSVLGYYVEGDGGGGLFRYDPSSSATDNGGTVIAPNSGSGRWLRVLASGPISVRWFGAKGDGATNDAPPIQAAINYLVPSGANYAAYQGGTVFFPKSEYLVNANLKLRSGIRLQGEGWASVLRGSTGCTAVVEAEVSADYSTVQGASIEDLTIDGTNWTDGRVGLYMTPQPGTGSRSSRNNFLRGVQFNMCGIGLKLINDQGINVTSCYFVNNDWGCTLTDNAQLGLFQQCDFRFNQRGLKIEATDVEITSAADAIYGHKFIRCHWEENWREGVLIDGGQSCSFDTCKWEGNGVTGAETQVTLQNDVSGKRCDNNSFTTCVWNGTAAAPTAKLLHLKDANMNLFWNDWFNGGSNGGILHDANVFHTRYESTVFVGVTRVDNGFFTSETRDGLWRYHSGDPSTGQNIILSPAIRVGDSDSAPKVLSGSGAPVGTDGSPIGSIYMRTDAGAANSIYVKTGTNTWTGK